ncbi:MAG TPA: GNAT family N-acetyltransferase [Candidatus Kapabacteria bacterium]|nr:GNAT family N-acetyltransferase [Candidatus Kapabacteria bacterium]
MNILVTPRLLLRPFEAADLDDVIALFSNIDVMRYIGSIRTPEESREKLMKMISEFHERGFGMFAVIDRKEKRFIGRCGLQTLDTTDMTELGYTFFPTAWGKGFATEASKAILQRAFDQWGLESVVAVANPENRVSVHIMEKIGMQYVRSDIFYGRQCVLYSISKKKPTQPSMRPFYDQITSHQSPYHHLGVK